MQRFKLEIPPVLPFSTEIGVRISDVNYGGHLGNDALLAILHEARVRYLKTMGLSEMDVGGVGIIMRDARVVFLNEAFHGDRLLVSCGVGEWGSAGCDMLYRVVRASDGTAIALAATAIVFFDYRKRRVVRVPGKFLDAIAGAEGLNNT